MAILDLSMCMFILLNIYPTTHGCEATNKTLIHISSITQDFYDDCTHGKAFITKFIQLSRSLPFSLPEYYIYTWLLYAAMHATTKLHGNGIQPTRRLLNQSSKWHHRNVSESPQWRIQQCLHSKRNAQGTHRIFPHRPLVPL